MLLRIGRVNRTIEWNISKILKKQGHRMILIECRDYLAVAKAFERAMIDFFETQLQQYLNMAEITEAYLQNVPPVVCWYEGMISTEDLIEAYNRIRQKQKN